MIASRMRCCCLSFNIEFIPQFPTLDETIQYDLTSSTSYDHYHYISTSYFESIDDVFQYYFENCVNCLKGIHFYRSSVLNGEFTYFDALQFFPDARLKYTDFELVEFFNGRGDIVELSFTPEDIGETFWRSYTVGSPPNCAVFQDNYKSKIEYRIFRA